MNRSALFLLLASPLCLAAQGRQEPGHSVGTVTTRGNLIVLTLNEGVLGKANMFDLGRRTLHFTPDSGGYRVENRAIEWDSDFGPELTSPSFEMHEGAFPFAGKAQSSFNVSPAGSIMFGGNLNIARFDQLQEAARNLISGAPAICVFEKPRMSGHRYVKETADKVTVTWDVTEPYGGIQDFTWTSTVNRFQAALHRDGAIDLSYDSLAAKDAIVGIYSGVKNSEVHMLGAARGEAHENVAAHLDIQSVQLSEVGGVFLKAAIETRGALPPPNDPRMTGTQYALILESGKHSTEWTLRAITRGGRSAGARYIASGRGVSPLVTVEGNRFVFQGVLPAELSGAHELSVSAKVSTAGTPSIVDRAPPQSIALSGLHGPEVDLSALKPSDGPFSTVFESFHYVSLPNPRDFTCSVILALGDKFDMLAYYSDFRVDNQEAGTPSTGPLGGNVTGIGQTQRGLESYCSKGRFQWQFVQPVYAESNQMYEQPPEGVTSTVPRDVTTYAKQLGERGLDGKMKPYNYAMSQIGHEMGHRWGAFVSAKVGSETIVLGPTHWARGLQAPVAFPYQRPTEASAMGGGVWQDNFDGTFTQLDDDYYVPATGWSYLDLYLMGLIAPSEVPDFFILRNLTPAGKDANGHPIFEADRTKVTIADVIAVEGARQPDVYHSQRDFNTGMVVVVEHGKTPSRELMERTNGIAAQWVEYWATTTGGRSKMTTKPR